MSKKCTRCNEIKTLDNFSKDCTRKDGLRGYCKSCVSNLRVKYNGPSNVITKEKKIKTIKEKPKHKQGEKQCSQCKKKKEYSMFPRSSSSKGGYQARCKECEKKTRTKKKEQEINYAAFYYPIALD